MCAAPRSSAGTPPFSRTPSFGGATPTCCWRRRRGPPRASCSGRSWPTRSTVTRRSPRLWPDFHHAADLEASGRAVDFLPEAAADAFCLRGDPAEVTRQLIDVPRSVPVPLDHVVLHPIPDPRFPDDPERGYTARVAPEVLPAVRSALD